MLIQVIGRWAKIGYLEQEPKLLEDKTVRENIETAVADTRALLNRFAARARIAPHGSQSQSGERQ